MTHQGGCLCGEVRYVLKGPFRETVHCHCRLCQKSSGAAFITWVTVAKADLEYAAGQPAAFRSSAGAQREFCGRCGTQLVFRADRGETLDIAAATLDAPDAVRPDANTWVVSRRAWAHGFDPALPDLEGEWPEGGL